jgi:hypothetical protein
MSIQGVDQMKKNLSASALSALRFMAEKGATPPGFRVATLRVLERAGLVTVYMRRVVCGGTMPAFNLVPQFGKVTPEGFDLIAAESAKPPAIAPRPSSGRT